MNCTIVRDLLPLYHDEVIGEESRKLVEEHLKTCAECKKILEDIHENVKSANSPDIEKQMQNGFKSIKKKLHQKNIVKISVAVICAVVVLSALIYGVFFYETPAPYSNVKQTIKNPINSASDFIMFATGHKSMAVMQYEDALYVSFSDTFWTRYIAGPSIPAKISYMGYMNSTAEKPEPLDLPEMPEPLEVLEIPEVINIGNLNPLLDYEEPESPEIPEEPEPLEELEPPEESNLLAIIGEAKKIFYVENDLSQISNELAFLVSIKNAVLIWEQ